MLRTNASPMNTRPAPLSLIWGMVALCIALGGTLPTNHCLAQNDSGAAASNVSMGQARIVVEREVAGNNSYIIVKISVPVPTHASSFVVSSPPRIVVDLYCTLFG